MSGFVYRGQISGAQDPVTVDIVMAPSVTFTVGDAIYTDDGLAKLATSSTDVFGIIVAIIDKNGIDLNNTSSSNYDGTWSESSNTYTSSATNDDSDGKQVRVKVVPDPYALWYNDADGDFTFPTDQFRMGNLLNENQLDESTFTEEDVGQFQLWEIDPAGTGNNSECLCRISRWQGSAMEPET